MPARPYYLLDVFTDRPLRGNPLAVVLEADGLSDEVMAGFARETRLSETTFVQRPRRPETSYRNRIWTVVRELPFAGHPSLGTAVAVALAEGRESARYVQETPAGLQPVEVELGGAGIEASMLQEPARFGPEVPPASALAPAGLEAGDAERSLPAQVVATGVPHLIVPVSGPEALARARPDAGGLRALLEPLDAVVLYLAACDTRSGRVRARSFTPVVEGLEDPATGSAAGPLCAYLAARSPLRRIDIAQGLEMGRPSRLLAELAGPRVRVSGGVVVVAEGTVRLPSA